MLGKVCCVNLREMITELEIVAAFAWLLQEFGVSDRRAMSTTKMPG
jgi:hypothetical protein